MILLLAGCPYVTDAGFAEFVDGDGDGVDRWEDCDSDDPDVAGPSAWFADGDGDGYGDEAVVACDAPVGAVPESGDCDDADPAVNPGATEVCDGVDGDCDGAVDDDAADAFTVYGDADGDGWGDEAIASRGCAGVETAGDCDDADAAVNPGAGETCDGIDSNCSGDESDATDAGSYFVDADGDGFGGAEVFACSPPVGAVGNASDCDDSDASVSPAAEETCSDGVDDDCDGTSVGCAPFGTLDAADAVARIAGVYGFPALDSAVLADLDGDDRAEVVLGASGTVFLWNRVLSGDLDLQDADGFLGGVTSAGESLGAADLDADGVAELLVGAPDAARVLVVSGPVTPEALLSPIATVSGEREQDAFGTSVAGAGDFDGDGIGDLAMGAPARTSGASKGGCVYVALGPVRGDADVADVALEFLGDTLYDYVGISVAGFGDGDGDGLADVVVGASGVDVGGTGAGAVYVLRGPTMEVDVLAGVEASERAGEAVAAAGDANGDGLSDFVVGAPGRSRAYVVSGAATSGGLDIAFAVITGDDYSSVGSAVASAGDLDGDGRDDLAIAATGASAPDYFNGAVALFYGPLAGAYLHADAPARFVGDDPSDMAGTVLAGGGDHDGDGYPDLLITAGGDDTAGANLGQTMIFLGGGI